MNFIDIMAEAGNLSRETKGPVPPKEPPWERLEIVTFAPSRNGDPMTRTRGGKVSFLPRDRRQWYGETIPVEDRRPPVLDGQEHWGVGILREGEKVNTVSLEASPLQVALRLQQLESLEFSGEAHPRHSALDSLLREVLPEYSDAFLADRALEAKRDTGELAKIPNWREQLQELRGKQGKGIARIEEWLKSDEGLHPEFWHSGLHGGGRFGDSKTKAAGSAPRTGDVILAWANNSNATSYYFIPQARRGDVPPQILNAVAAWKEKHAKEIGQQKYYQVGIYGLRDLARDILNQSIQP